MSADDAVSVAGAAERGDREARSLELTQWGHRHAHSHYERRVAYDVGPRGRTE